MRGLLKNLPKQKPIVVKVGTRLLTNSRGHLNEGSFTNIVNEVAALKEMGHSVILVTSGAVTAGREIIHTRTRKWSLSHIQAAAAIGQPVLMAHYREAFSKSGIDTAQLLITHDDITHRKRFTNMKRTLMALLDLGVLPLVNENDSVSVEEIKIGDNDTLSGKIAYASDASVLIILTDVEGLKKNGKCLPLVQKITPEIEALAGGRGSSFSIGGMKTKILCAKQMMKSGIATVIASGRKKNILRSIISGKDAGTFFLPGQKSISDRKTWIYFCQVLRGGLILDAGATTAIVEKGKSLLPSGIVQVMGEFPSKSTLQILDESGEEMGRGITNFSSTEIEQILGKHSDEIKEILPGDHSRVVIHRNNLVLKPGD